MCHNCGSRTLRLDPMPPSLEALRQRLARDRRWADRRYGEADERLLGRERRVGQRRLTSAQRSEWVDADDLIIEILEVPGDDSAPEATRIASVGRESRP